MATTKPSATNACARFACTPGRATRAVGDDDQPAVAASRRALPGHLEGERTSLELPRLAGGRVVHGDGASAVLTRDLGQADAGLGRRGQDRERDRDEEADAARFAPGVTPRLDHRPPTGADGAPRTPRSPRSSID